MQEFVRHIWGVELRWSQRLAALPVLAREEMPAGPLDALFDLHRRAVEIFRGLLATRPKAGTSPLRLIFSWLPPEAAARFPAQGLGTHAVPQPAPLGATGHSGARGRVSLGVPRRPAVQLCAA